MAKGYYYLITSLPELSLRDKQLDYNMITYRDHVREALDSADFELLKVLYYRWDILNFIHLIKAENTPWLPEGNYSREAFVEMLEEPETLPPFLRQFQHEYAEVISETDTKTLINWATSLFVDWCNALPNAFLRRWMRFDINLKNLLVWLNTHKFGLPASLEVLGSHTEAEQLRTFSRNELNLKAWDFRYREVMVHFDNPNIALREFVLDEMRWHYLNELEEHYFFGIERVLAFAIRLQMIDRNLRTTETEGRERLLQLLKNIRDGNEMPQAFAETAVPHTSETSLENLIKAETNNP